MFKPAVPCRNPLWTVVHISPKVAEPMRSPRSRAMTVSMAGIAFIGLGAMTAAPALAAPAPAAPSFVMQAEALIDEDRPTSLAIHKYQGAPTGNLNDGTLVTGIDLPILQGVQFDVYQVGGVDLTTNEGWAAATALQAHTITQAEIAAGEIVLDGVTYTLTPAQSVTTDATGTALFDEAAVGLYLVNENLAESTITDADSAPVASNSVTPAVPFMVTLPMTTPSGEGALTTWMYDVHAYPKNSVDTITKSVTDMGSVTTDHDGEYADSQIMYTINSSVTEGYVYEAGDTYVIGDRLDSRVTFTGARITGLTPEVDYTVYVNDAVWDGSPVAGAKVEVVLTDAGLVKLNGMTEVVTEIDATVGAADADGITEFLNEAMLIPNAGWWASNTGTDDPYDPETDDPNQPGGGDPIDPPTSNEVRSLYGALDITKVDASDTTVLLDGAVFAVYADGDNTETCTASDVTAANLISGGHTTDADGVVQINGLQTSDFYNNAEQTNLLTYCLVETQAADGYNLLADAIPFTILSDGDPAVATIRAMQVENVLSNLDNDLPLTGGAGAAGLGLGALALLGGAGAYAMKRRSANNKMDETVASA